MFWSVILVMTAGILLPMMGFAQNTGLSGDIGGLQATLDTVYNTMIVKSASLIGIASAIAGFAATWYIAVRVWGHISRAEPVDLFPLLRPFVIGFAITIFPSVIGLINGVMQPTVSGTA